ncbi:MAG TPA: VWA domain-containing protein [Anaerolineae bacterium]
MNNQRDKRRRGAIVLVFLAGTLVLCLGATLFGFLIRRSTPPASSTGQAAVAANEARLTIAYSPEKAALVKSLADKFNAKNLRTPDRQTMQVLLVEKTPDQMVSEALSGPSFQAINPDSSLWVDQLNRRYAAAQAGPATPTAGQIPSRLVGDPVRYAITPIVIAAWDDTARKLGWPNQPVGWSTLQNLAKSDPNFKWNHSSTGTASGLLATLAEFYAGAGVQRGLTADQAQDKKTLDFVTGVEKTVRYYGEGELAVVQRAAKDGPKYLDAFVVSEQLVVALNTGAFGKAPSHLVAIYPAEGTLWADHPLALLETPDVTANQRRTFQAFREFLAGQDVQSAILAAGYRPADLNIPLGQSGSPLTAANGVDPKQPQTTLQLPSADVVSAVQNVFTLTKRKTNVFLVVDTSGSMSGTKLNNVKEALKTFIGEIPSDQESLGLVEFNTSVVNIIELKPLAENRGPLLQSINGMRAGGNTALYDAVRTAYERLQQNNDPARINAIVVMTDGIENASHIGLQPLVNEIKTGNQKLQVVIFTIGYGNDADMRTLQQLADAGGGQARAGTPETIQGLYKTLSSYFGG